MVGPGQADRHRPLLRHLRQRPRRLHGHDRPASINPATGRALRRSTSRSSPSATWCAPRRMLLDHLGIEQPVLRDRRLDGRHAGAAMGRELSRARLRGPADRHRRAPFRAEHRLPRGRAAGRHGRSGLARRPLPRAKARGPRKGLAVARMAAHITYLSEAALHRKFGRNLQDRDALTFGFDADFQIESYLRHQGMHLRRPLRRQLLSLHDARDGLFRPRRGPWRRARGAPSAARRRASASSPSPPTGCSRPRSRARSCTR